VKAERRKERADARQHTALDSPDASFAPERPAPEASARPGLPQANDDTRHP